MNIVLQLTYDPQCSQTTGAAYIRGNAPSLWLKEIDSWQIPLEGLKCLVIPASTGSVTPAGLLVIFDKKIPESSLITHAYATVGNKLFIPVHASLHPLLSEEEMETLLIWRWQVFHPGIGFVGFNSEDELQPADLVTFMEPDTTKWDLAHPGMPAMARLNEISLEKQDEVLEELKKEVIQKPISEIHTSWFEKLKALFTKKKSKPATSIEESRDSELKKLVKLFDTDSDKALKYALPLNTRYAGRGTASPSSTLNRHESNFSLTGLGGGQRVDTWNTDKYHSELISKYYSAAEKAKAAGDYKKAAYIYAHLLSNYLAAAQVLRLGGLHREAAILYRDHLNMKKEAAECFYSGRMLPDAVKLYVELVEFEKAGDVYLEMSQPDKAAKYYHKSIDQHLALDNFYGAGVIRLLKLKQKGEALATFLMGWDKGHSALKCMQRYMDVVREQNEDDVPGELQHILDVHTPPAMETNFLQLISAIHDKTVVVRTKDVIREMAYQLISKQAIAGNTKNMNLLEKFVPDDKQITVDYNRFRNKHS